MRPWLKTCALALLLLAPSPALEAADSRLVVIGDIHGADAEFDAILLETGLIDENRNWSGTGTHFVQTGDFTDRGSGMRAVMDLLMKLQQQAIKRGDEVEILLGNHEVMNLILEDRDLRVNPAIFASFADQGSEKRRKKAYDDWLEWRQRRVEIQERIQEIVEKRGDEFEPPRDEVAAFLGQTREEWLAEHPLGMVELREAFGQDGTYGRWLRELPIATRVDDWLFLHGGVSSEWLGRSLREINRIHRVQIETWTRDRARLERRSLVLPWFSWKETRLALEHHLMFPRSASEREEVVTAWTNQNELIGELFAEESPLWFRGYALPPLGLTDEALATLLDATEEAYGAKRVAAGHTPVSDRTILERLDGRAYQIDTGMLRAHYKGRPAALEVLNGEARAIVLGEAAFENQEVEAEPAVADEPAEEAANSAAAAAPVASEPEPEASTSESAAEPLSGRVFLAPDLQPLTIQDRDEIERFLMHAAVVHEKPAGQGKSGALKVVLEQDGVRAHAIFHDIDDTTGRPGQSVRLSNGQRIRNFRDSFTGQIAAYELGKLLGIDNIPPTVPRRHGGDRGSIALWIENGINLFGWREQGEKDPKGVKFWNQMYDMRVFDQLIDNFDRNTQNIFWSGDFDIWLIDHTRSFTRNRKLLREDRVTRCSRDLYERLRDLDVAEVRERLDPYLGSLELKALMLRRDRVLEILDERIQEKGEDRVFIQADVDSPEEIDDLLDD